MSSRPNRRYNQIGLDRLVRVKWVERTAYLFWQETSRLPSSLSCWESSRDRFEPTRPQYAARCTKRLRS